MAAQDGSPPTKKLKSCSRGVTRRVVKEHTFDWTIEAFSRFTSKDKIYIASPEFRSGEDECVWRLRLKFDPSSDGESDDVQLMLYLCSSNKGSVDVRYKFCIINSANEDVNISQEADNICRRFKVIPNPSAPCKDWSARSNAWGYDKFTSKQALRSSTPPTLLVNDELHIKCLIYHEVKDNHSQVGDPKIDGRDFLIDNLGDLMEDAESSDVTLKVGTQEFKSHIAILKVRSAVFAAMFRTDMREKQNKEVEIEDIDADVFSNFLRFIYTGSCQVEDKTTELLACADKYGLEDLKTMCGQYLEQNLHLENAVDTLILADTYSAEGLKAASVKFITGNITHIKVTNKWKSLLDSHANLGLEILRCLTS